MKLAFADAYRYIADEPLPAGYLDEDYLASRRAQVDLARAGDPGPGLLPRGGTVYLSVVDRDRMACSFIQSLYIRFGSRVVAPGTGVMLQNRGGCFTLEAGHPNRLAPGRRPFHTIIPGMLLDAAGLVGPFGLMGGHVQPQGHLQLITNLRQRGLGPQAALDAPALAARPGRRTAGCCAWSRGCGTSPTSSSAAAIASGATPTPSATAAARRSCCAATSWWAAPSRARTASQPATDARAGSRRG